MDLLNSVFITLKCVVFNNKKLKMLIFIKNNIVIFIFNDLIDILKYYLIYYYINIVLF